MRRDPDDDQAEVTAAQVRDVVTRLIAAGHWQERDLAIVDAGYDAPRLACQLADLPVQILGRLRSDQVLCFAAPPRRPDTNGRPGRHGGEFTLADAASWPPPTVATPTWTTRLGAAVAQAWDRLHPRLTHRSARLDHIGGLAVIAGTLIRLQVDRLRGDRDPKPVWLCCSQTQHPARRRGPVLVGGDTCAAERRVLEGHSQQAGQAPNGAPNGGSTRFLVGPDCHSA